MEKRQLPSHENHLPAIHSGFTVEREFTFGSDNSDYVVVKGFGNNLVMGGYWMGSLPRIQTRNNFTASTEHYFVLRESVERLFKLTLEEQKISLEEQQKCESTIRKLLETASEKNWNGEDSDPVSQNSVNAALNIVPLLPASVESPEISADPLGNVEFDWYLDNGTMFTISVGHSGSIAISGLNPEKARLRGLEEDFEGDPVRLLNCGLQWLIEMHGK